MTSKQRKPSQSATKRATVPSGASRPGVRMTHDRQSKGAEATIPGSLAPGTVAADNPRAFKHAVGAEAASRLASDLRKVYPSFDAAGFVREAQRGLPALELKPRIRFLSDAMAKRLPRDYPSALQIVLGTLGPELVEGAPVSANMFHYWVHGSFVEVYGLEHFPESLAAMREITKRSTSEFAVRPFLERDLGQVLTFLEGCVDDPSPHVRRWISEGTRPFLPWGKRVPALLKEPTLALALVEKLRDDRSAYVRTSLANHLNDVSKLQPELAVATINAWSKAEVPDVGWLAKRALRGLVKAGYPAALSVFGARATTRAELTSLRLEKARISVGEHLEFELMVKGAASEQLVVDYALSFPGAAGRTSRKVFKLASKSVKKGELLSMRKRHSFRPITTRVYRAGKHTVEILVNGKVLGSAQFSLVL
jgi:3-methyladenine DNA glycosylase AlkC